MNNLLPSEVVYHQKFDLKGSTYKRKAGKHERAKTLPTYKDLDFRDMNPEVDQERRALWTALRLVLTQIGLRIGAGQVSSRRRNAEKRLFGKVGGNVIRGTLVAKARRVGISSVVGYISISYRY